MRKMLLRWLINAVAVYTAMELIGGIYTDGGWTVFLWMALILGVVNALIAPVLKILTCPLIILTLGLFTLVINALMLWLAGVIASAVGVGFYIEGFGAAFLGALVISVVSFALSTFMGVNQEEK
ncbi:MAG: phage holin family protein [Anaerolineales bacterium]